MEPSRKNDPMNILIYIVPILITNLFKMDSASRNGDTTELDKLLLENRIEYTTNAVDLASKYGHVNVLDWWFTRKRTLQFKYTLRSVKHASKNNQVKVLEWWYNKCSMWVFGNCTKPIIYAFAEGHIQTVEWWFQKRRYVKFRYVNNLVDSASVYGRVELLDWWYNLAQVKENGIEFNYSADAVDYATMEGNLASLDWWMKKHREDGLEFKYSVSKVVSFASMRDNADMLDWWFYVATMNGIKFEYTSRDVDQASYSGKYEVIKWWIDKFKNGLEMKYTNYAILWNSHSQIMEMWVQSGLPLFIDIDTVDGLFWKNYLYAIHYLMTLYS